MDRSKVLKFLAPADSAGECKGVDWVNIVINAGIMAGITFFSSIVSQVPIPNAAAAAGLAFFMSLGVQRGLVKKE